MAGIKYYIDKEQASKLEAEAEKLGLEVDVLIKLKLESSSNNETLDKLHRAISHLADRVQNCELILKRYCVINEAENYYRQENYYSQEESKQNSEWYGQGAFGKVANSQKVEERLKDKELTEGQYSAVMTASTSSDSVVAWQGKAGAGKTYALNEFKQIAEERGYTVKGLAPSAEAAKVLGDELGIESQTVARHLISQQQKENKFKSQIPLSMSQPPKHIRERQEQQMIQAHLEKEYSSRPIWIVDEAGLLNAKDTHELLKRAEQEEAKVLLVINDLF